MFLMEWKGYVPGGSFTFARQIPSSVFVIETGLLCQFVKLAASWTRRAPGALYENQELLTIFEAARWAPSTYNEQEWRLPLCPS